MITLNCDICKTQIEQNDNTIGKFSYAEPNYAMTQNNPQVVGLKGIEHLLCGECKKWMLNEMENKEKSYGK